jgi:hypothetical protein
MKQFSVFRLSQSYKSFNFKVCSSKLIYNNYKITDTSHKYIFHK